MSDGTKYPSKRWKADDKKSFNNASLFSVFSGSVFPSERSVTERSVTERPVAAFSDEDEDVERGTQRRNDERKKDRRVALGKRSPSRKIQLEGERTDSSFRRPRSGDSEALERAASDRLSSSSSDLAVPQTALHRHYSAAEDWTGGLKEGRDFSARPQRRRRSSHGSLPDEDVRKPAASVVGATWSRKHQNTPEEKGQTALDSLARTQGGGDGSLPDKDVRKPAASVQRIHRGAVPDSSPEGDIRKRAALVVAAAKKSASDTPVQGESPKLSSFTRARSKTKETEDVVDDDDMDRKLPAVPERQKNLREEEDVMDQKMPAQGQRNLEEEDVMDRKMAVDTKTYKGGRKNARLPHKKRGMAAGLTRQSSTRSVSSLSTAGVEAPLPAVREEDIPLTTAFVSVVGPESSWPHVKGDEGTPSSWSSEKGNGSHLAFGKGNATPSVRSPSWSSAKENARRKSWSSAKGSGNGMVFGEGNGVLRCKLSEVEDEMRVYKEDVKRRRSTPPGQGHDRELLARYLESTGQDATEASVIAAQFAESVNDTMRGGHDDEHARLGENEEPRNTAEGGNDVFEDEPGQSEGELRGYLTQMERKKISMIGGSEIPPLAFSTYASHDSAHGSGEGINSSENELLVNSSSPAQPGPEDSAAISAHSEEARARLSSVPPSQATLATSTRTESSSMPLGTLGGAPHGAGRGRGGRRQRLVRATTPGAVPMEGRAYGVLPAWGRPTRQSASRNGSNSSTASPRINDSSTGAGVEASSPAGPEHLVEATIVCDEDDPVLLAHAESMPSSIKLLLKERSVQVCVLLTFFLFVGIALLVAGVAYSAFDEGSSSAEDATEDVMNVPTVPTAAPTAAPTVVLDELKEFLAPVSGLEALEEVGSPQHSAMFWLANIDATGSDFTDRMFLQRYALIVLYYATSNVDSWLSTERWLDTHMHECDWGRQVTCVKDRLGQRVLTALDLSKNGLTGAIPPEIGLLGELVVLHLNDNFLQGTIPDEIGDLPSLVVLEMEGNQFTGSIPKSIGNLTDLTVLDLSHNRLNGTITERLYELEQLRSLDLCFNEITGQLSSDLRKFTVLTSLNLMMNRISGPIPDSFDAMTNLAFLYLDFNKITGSIPTLSGLFMRRKELTISHNMLTGKIPDVDITNIDIEQVRISKVDLSHNMLTGTFPAAAGFISTLEYMDFSNNMLDGPIIPTLGYMASLEHLCFQKNKFSGGIPKVMPPSLRHLELQGNHLDNGIPSELGSLSSLQYLSLGDNRLEGELPDEVLSMSSLKYLNLQNCSLSGSIPNALSRMRQLAFLYLGDNSLSDSIPSEVGNLESLSHLSLHDNSLSGTVPSSIGNLKDLAILSLHRNELKGTIPEEIANLRDLEELHLFGNSIRGEVPGGVCTLREEKLKTIQVDCEVHCSCCLFEVCGNGN